MKRFNEWLERNHMYIVIYGSIIVGIMHIIRGNTDASIGWLIAALWAWRSKCIEDIADRFSELLNRITKGEDND